MVKRGVDELTSDERFYCTRNFRHKREIDINQIYYRNFWPYGAFTLSDTKTDTETEINRYQYSNKELKRICVGICLCEARTLPHNSTQPILSVSLMFFESSSVEHTIKSEVVAQWSDRKTGLLYLSLRGMYID